MPEEVEDPAEAAAAAAAPRAPAMAQPQVPSASRVPSTSLSPAHGTWRQRLRVRNLQNRFSRRLPLPLPAPPHPSGCLPFYGQSEPGTRAPPPGHGPPVGRGAIQVVSREGAEPLADTWCSAPRGFPWGSQAKPLRLGLGGE